MSKKWEYRDVSVLLQVFRDFLLGRKHTLHPRFPLKVAPRSIPPPDIPRAVEYKYSNQYYYERNAFDSVKPPVVAPVAEADGGMKPDSVRFTGLPMPGTPWLWDGHTYFECVPDPDRRPPCPPPSPPPERSQPSPCDPPVTPCPPTPDKRH